MPVKNTRTPFIFLVNLTLGTIAQNCYLPNGVDINYAYQEWHWSSCNLTRDGGTNSMCCAWHGNHFDPCGKDTGLCWNEDTTKWYRGGCTDPTWTDPGCTQFALDGTDNGNPFRNAWYSVRNCTDGTWCPNNTNSSCCNNHQGQVIKEGKVLPVSVTSPILQISPTAFAEPSLATRSGAETGATWTANYTGTQPTAGVPLQHTLSTVAVLANETSASTSHIMSTNTIVGAGVGGGLGLALTAALVLGLVLRHQRKMAHLAQSHCSIGHKDPEHQTTSPRTMSSANSVEPVELEQPPEELPPQSAVYKAYSSPPEMDTTT